LIGELAYPLTGSSDCTSTMAAARRQHQLHHRPRRLHPARSGQFTTTSTTKPTARTTRTANAQPLLELRGRGPTDDPEINWRCALRQRRNLLATLLLSQGVPMLLAGDEVGRTQRGNNNAYCQDNELSWLNWELLAVQNRELA
jgi:hypothetical protein